MKNLAIFGLMILLLASCHNYKKDAQQLAHVRDSIQREATVKDSTILSYLSDFNEIQANLDSIKTLEELVTVQSETNRELTNTQKERILEDIVMINELLQKNKALTASLQKKLKNSNYKVGKLETTIKQLQQMVNNLEAQARDKNNEILALNDQVQQLNINVKDLTSRIHSMDSVRVKQVEFIEKQKDNIDVLNQAFYVFGTKKELKDKNVIDRNGGILGIGRTSTIPKNFNHDYFTSVDIRDFSYLRLMSKKATLVSVHPADSYHISGDKSADTLFIDNPSQFWKASRYLVIVTK
ncbi:MAG: hypothetical protein CSA36_05155 [Draconibacterium sp.]|nr:MAG: hypothetical protein CSA36_05155 [Draconibacterium sp.]